MSADQPKMNCFFTDSPEPLMKLITVEWDALRAMVPGDRIVLYRGEAGDRVVDFGPGPGGFTVTILRRREHAE